MRSFTSLFHLLGNVPTRLSNPTVEISTSTITFLISLHCFCFLLVVFFFFPIVSALSLSWEGFPQHIRFPFTFTRHVKADQEFCRARPSPGRQSSFSSTRAALSLSVGVFPLVVSVHLTLVKGHFPENKASGLWQNSHGTGGLTSSHTAFQSSPPVFCQVFSLSFCTNWNPQTRSLAGSLQFGLICSCWFSSLKELRIQLPLVN